MTSGADDGLQTDDVFGMECSDADGIVATIMFACAGGSEASTMSGKFESADGKWAIRVGAADC